mmetsp:Transcript_23578/g.55710  ORF Transcript_23578/g.55710 Transcript_23578/m.55710 type:complete len:217 (+) Transcript_23578:107-757(+)
MSGGLFCVLTSFVTPTNDDRRLLDADVWTVRTDRSPLSCSISSTISSTSTLSSQSLSESMTALPSTIVAPAMTTPVSFFFRCPENGHESRSVPSLRTSSSSRPMLLLLYSPTRPLSMRRSTSSSAVMLTMAWLRTTGWSWPWYLCGNFPLQTRQSPSSGPPTPSSTLPGMGMSSNLSSFSVMYFRVLDVGVHIIGSLAALYPMATRASTACGAMGL